MRLAHLSMHTVYPGFLKERQARGDNALFCECKHVRFFLRIHSIRETNGDLLSTHIKFSSVSFVCQKKVGPCRPPATREARMGFKGHCDVIGQVRERGRRDE